MDSDLEEARAVLPNLKNFKHGRTSDPDDRYKGIAYVMGETNMKWWPADVDEVIWPPDAPLEETIPAFAAAFRSKGFAVSSSGSFDNGKQKIALYCVGQTPTHAAIQIISGKHAGNWSSKLGDLIDIFHETVEAVECDAYGKAIAYFERNVSNT